MDIYSKRCKHCGIEYLFQASGEGCLERPESANYCGECQTVIDEALKKIPVKEVKVVLRDSDQTPSAIEVLSYYNSENYSYKFPFVLYKQGSTYKYVKYHDNKNYILIETSTGELLVKREGWIKVEDRKEKEYVPPFKLFTREDIYNEWILPEPDEQIYFLKNQEE